MARGQAWNLQHTLKATPPPTTQSLHKLAPSLGRIGRTATHAHTPVHSFHTLLIHGKVWTKRAGLRGFICTLLPILELALFFQSVDQSVENVCRDELGLHIATYPHMCGTRAQRIFFGGGILGTRCQNVGIRSEAGLHTHFGVRRCVHKNHGTQLHNFPTLCIHNGTHGWALSTLWPKVGEVSGPS